MKYLVIQTRMFSAKARFLRLSLEDIRAIENDILADPAAWPVMAGTHGLRKMRFSPERHAGGKSGGLRICYFFLDETKRVYLLTAFAKNAQANLNAADRQALGQVVASIKAHDRQEP
jgi:hypothetical protein